MQSINLIPDQEVQEQTKTRVVKFSTLFSIFLLIVVGAISAYYFYQTSNLTKQIEQVTQEIEGLRADITALSPIEISARNLDTKYKFLTQLFASRSDYSYLTKELRARKPEGIVLDSLTIQRGVKLNISGFGSNYIAIAALTNNLIDPNFAGGDPNLKKLFTSVSLNTVSLEKGKGLVRFSITLDFNPELLRNK